jgi:GGDEF domain-containing protein
MTFSHDGIHDSLTQLFSAPYFYEELDRQIALSERSGSKFTIIRCVLRVENTSEQDFEAINFSHLLSSLTRKNECVARMAENEYVILVPEHELNAAVVLSRIVRAHNSSESTMATLSTSIIEHQAKESSLELLNRLDKTPLST